MFRKSNKTQRSPERGGVEKMIRRWREEMGEVMKELKGMKEWKEELRQMKKEVREEIREQGRL